MSEEYHAALRQYASEGALREMTVDEKDHYINQRIKEFEGQLAEALDTQSIIDAKKSIKKLQAPGYQPDQGWPLLILPACQPLFDIMQIPAYQSEDNPHWQEIDRPYLQEAMNARQWHDVGEAMEDYAVAKDQPLHEEVDLAPMEKAKHDELLKLTQPPFMLLYHKKDVQRNAHIYAAGQARTILKSLDICPDGDAEIGVDTALLKNAMNTRQWEKLDMAMIRASLHLKSLEQKRQAEREPELQEPENADLLLIQLNGALKRGDLQNIALPNEPVFVAKGSALHSLKTAGVKLTPLPTQGNGFHLVEMPYLKAILKDQWQMLLENSLKMQDYHYHQIEIAPLQFSP